MKITLSDKEKKIAPFALVAVLIILYILERWFVKITDIAYVNGEPYEIEIKSGFILPKRTNMLITTGEVISVRNHSFKFIGNDLYKDGKKVITLKTDDEYQKSKTTPLIRI